MLIDGVRKAVSDLVAAAKLYKTWYYLAVQEMIGRYRRSLLGPLWIAGGLASTAISLTIVFGALFGQPIKEFLPFVMTGILSWNIVSLPMTEAADVFVVSGGTIKTFPFPYMFYIFRLIARSVILLAHNIVVYMITVVAIGGFTGWHWTLLPGLVVTYLFVLVWAPVVALMASRFRDLRFMMPYIAQVLFFLTPIFWQPHNLVGARALIVTYNPFYHVLELMRQPLIGHAPDASHWVASLAVVGLGAVVWLFSFAAFRSRIPFWV